MFSYIIFVCLKALHYFSPFITKNIVYISPPQKFTTEWNFSCVKWPDKTIKWKNPLTNILTNFHLVFLRNFFNKLKITEKMQYFLIAVIRVCIIDFYVRMCSESGKYAFRKQQFNQVAFLVVLHQYICSKRGVYWRGKFFISLCIQFFMKKKSENKFWWVKLRLQV